MQLMYWKEGLGSDIRPPTGGATMERFAQIVRVIAGQVNYSCSITNIVYNGCRRSGGMQLPSQE